MRASRIICTKGWVCLCFLALAATRGALAYVLGPNPIRGTVTNTKLFSATVDEAATKTLTTTTPEERAEIAKSSWRAIALAETSNRDETIDLSDESLVSVYNQELFEEFKTITGTYFINGLSSCKVGDRLMHPFEAHGFCKSFCFSQGKLRLKTAIVETPLTKLERRFKVPLARGVMSSLANPILNIFLNQDRDTANLSATLWPPPGTTTTTGEQQEPVLIVAGDNGAPYMIDPVTLQTIGKLQNRVPELRGKKLLAHNRIDNERQRLILCSSSFVIEPGTEGGGKTVIEFMEFDVNFQLVASRTFQTRFMVFHDWMITDTYYVVPKNPANFLTENLSKFLLGQISGVGIFDMDESNPGELVLIPRHDEDGEILECKADSFFNIFHFGPCFEDKTSGAVTVYASVFDRYSFGGEMGFDQDRQEFDPIAWSGSADAPAPRLDKFVLQNGRIVQRERIPLLTERDEDVPVDMPTFNGDGAVCNVSYFVGGSRPEGWFPFRSVLKADLSSKRAYNWDAGDDKIVSEAMFVPRGRSEKEDDGFVLSIVHGATEKNCELMVWDAERFAEGPIGSISLGDLMPWCVHGSWESGFVTTFE